MTPNARTLYVVGFGLGLLGVLAIGASLLLAGTVGLAVLALGSTFPFVVGLRKYLRKEPPDLTPTTTYRLANWGGAVFVVAIGLLLVAVGVASLSFFG